MIPVNGAVFDPGMGIQWHQVHTGEELEMGTQEEDPEERRNQRVPWKGMLGRSLQTRDAVRALSPELWEWGDPLGQKVACPLSYLQWQAEDILRHTAGGRGLA